MQEDRGRAGGARTQEWLAIGALVAVSTAARAWAALDVRGPWIAPDEIVYGLLGVSLVRSGSLELLGDPTPFYSVLTPLFLGLPTLLFGTELAYDAVRVLQALAMSLAALPVYLWGRSFLSARGAVTAAALAVAIPALAYSGLLLSEVLWFPLFALTAWAAAAAIAHPSAPRQALLVGAVAALATTRLQAVALVPAVATAIALDAVLARSASKLWRLAPAAGALVALVLAWIGWNLVAGSSALGGYDAVAETSYGVAAIARFVLYHAGAVAVLVGLVPVCAVGLMLVRGLRDGERDPVVRAYLAVTTSFTLWLVLQVGVFASQHAERIVERYLIALAPLLFLGLVLWLERGAPGRYVERAAVALVTAALVLVLPVDRFVNAAGIHDWPSAVALYELSRTSSTATLVAVYSAATAVGVVAFALLGRRALRALPVLLFALLVLSSAIASDYVADAARAQRASLLGGEPRWIDKAANGPTAYLYAGDPLAVNGVWLTLFWNRQIDRVYGLDAAVVPGPLPQYAIRIRGDGRVVAADGHKPPLRYVVASRWLTFAGEPIADISQTGLTQPGLALWRIDRPLRVATQTVGVRAEGDIWERARLLVYDCAGGTYRLTLLIKRPVTVDLFVSGRRYRRLRFETPEYRVWNGAIRVGPGAGPVCTLDVVPSDVVGTTLFTFERAPGAR